MRHIDVERTTYGTVVLMSVLVVYDGWGTPATFRDTVLVILEPTLALLLAHLFADVMAYHVEVQRPLRPREWGRLALMQAGTIAAAVPPIALVLLGAVSPLDPEATILVLLWTGVGTLAVLSALVARRAQYRGWRVWVAGALGGSIGLVVIALQVLLKPH